MSEIRLRNDTGEALNDVRLTTPDRPRRSRCRWGPSRRAPVFELGTRSPTAQRHPAIEAIRARHQPRAPSLRGHGAQPVLPAGRYTYALRLEVGRLVVDLEPEEV